MATPIIDVSPKILAQSGQVTEIRLKEYLDEYRSSPVLHPIFTIDGSCRGRFLRAVTLGTRPDGSGYTVERFQTCQASLLCIDTKCPCCGANPTHNPFDRKTNPSGVARIWLPIEAINYPETSYIAENPDQYEAIIQIRAFGGYVDVPGGLKSVISYPTIQRRARLGQPVLIDDALILPIDSNGELRTVVTDPKFLEHYGRLEMDLQQIMAQVDRLTWENRLLRRRIQGEETRRIAAENDAMILRRAMETQRNALEKLSQQVGDLKDVIARTRKQIKEQEDIEALKEKIAEIQLDHVNRIANITSEILEVREAIQQHIVSMEEARRDTMERLAEEQRLLDEAARLIRQRKLEELSRPEIKRAIEASILDAVSTVGKMLHGAVEDMSDKFTPDQLSILHELFDSLPAALSRYIQEKRKAESKKEEAQKIAPTKVEQKKEEETETKPKKKKE